MPLIQTVPLRFAKTIGLDDPMPASLVERVFVEKPRCVVRLPGSSKRLEVDRALPEHGLLGFCLTICLHHETGALTAMLLYLA